MEDSAVFKLERVFVAVGNVEASESVGNYDLGF